MGKTRRDAFVRKPFVSGPERPELTPMQKARWNLERMFDFLRDRDDTRLLKELMAGGSRG